MMKQLSLWLAIASCAFAQDSVNANPELIAAGEASKPRILVHNAQGLVLGKDKPALEDFSPEDPSGVYIIDLDLPGSRNALAARLDPLYYGKNISKEDVSKIREEIRSFYIENNHPFVTVTVPPQELKAGVLKLLVIESTVGTIEVKGNRYFKEALFTAPLQVGRGDPVNENTLAKNLQTINRNPFRAVNAIYSAGKDPNTTNIELYVRDRFPLRVYSGIDNTGIRPMGHFRFYTGINWANVFGLGHMLSLQYTTDSTFHNLMAATFHYTAPVASGFTALCYGGYSQTNVPYKRLPEFKVHGNSVQVSGRLQFPLTPRYGLVQELEVGADFKQAMNIMRFGWDGPIANVGNTQLTQLALQYTLGYQTSLYNFTLTGEFYVSPIRWLPHQNAISYGHANPGALPQYVYMRIGSTGWIMLPKEWSVSGAARLQLANQNLLTSEQVGIGGYDTVRGYAERQLSTDNAIILNGEIRTPKFGVIRRFTKNELVQDTMQFLGFLDYGCGWYHIDLPPAPPFEFLFSGGFGVRYFFGQFLTVRADYGFKIHRADYPGGMGELHFGLIGSY